MAHREVVVACDGLSTACIVELQQVSYFVKALLLFSGIPLFVLRERIPQLREVGLCVWVLVSASTHVRISIWASVCQHQWVWYQYMGISVWVSVYGHQCVSISGYGISMWASVGIGISIWASVCQHQCMGISVWASVYAHHAHHQHRETECSRTIGQLKWGISSL